MKKIAFTVLSLAFVYLAWGSEPGEPLDCSDWIFLEPGFSCSEFIHYPGETEFSRMGYQRELVPDNEGYLLRIQSVDAERDPTCGSMGQSMNRVELIRTNGLTETVVGYITDRCAHQSQGFVDRVKPRYETVLRFDPINGRMFLELELYCYGCSPGSEVYYENGSWVPAIEGFATIFEIMQSYQRNPPEITFRVPYMPEGMDAADWFDTYWGNLSTVGDWSQAQPLQCDYPATPPNVGDYLTVPDTLPTPSPGAGYYYITAATYLGETRYGRKAEGGVLSGRDPVVLPECVN